MAWAPDCQQFVKGADVRWDAKTTSLHKVQVADTLLEPENQRTFAAILPAMEAR